MQYFSYTLGKEGLLPQEEMLAVKRDRKKLTIGIPKEDHEIEKSVMLTPEAVELLVSNGHEVLIEEKAGDGANYKRTDYSERGGCIVKERARVMQADVVLKVSPFNEDDIEQLQGRQLLLSSVHMNNHTRECLRLLMKKKVTAIAYECIQDEHEVFPVERSMNAIAGNTAILTAAEYLSNQQQGKGVMLGGLAGITPAEVVILGAGTTAEFAARTALGMGVFVKIFDDSVLHLEDLQRRLNQQVYTSIFHPQVLRKALNSADVVIGAFSRSEKLPKLRITEDMVKKMKPQSVIIDLTLDQGGCFETSEVRTMKRPSFTKHGVIHYCVPNITSRVARTSSIALSNIFAPLLLKMGEMGGVKNQIIEDVGLRKGVYVYNGILTNAQIGKYTGLPYQDINLLLAAF
jgi:alanine dehydrogenase